MKKRAFTLVELMVVLAVIAIISTITFGVISNTAASNRRVQCAANMAQIYGALRLYSQDYDGQFPYFNPTTIEPPNAPATSNLKTGLWALFQYTNGTKTGYLKSDSVLFSPADKSNQRATNTSYSSYQTQDDGGVWTYSTFRELESRRQLRFVTQPSPSPSPLATPQRRPSDATVVFWSRWHRRLDVNNNFATIPDDKNNRDNVLFFDGRVQSLPVNQEVVDTANNTNVCTGWKRVPKERELKMANAANCNPGN